MRRGRRLRRLLFGVAGTTAAFVALARWTGWGPPVPAAGGDAGGVTTPAGAAERMSAGDLSFYDSLGGRKPGASGRGSTAYGPAPAGGARGGSSDAGGVYLVQVLATRDAAEARRVRDRLASRGFPATVQEGRVGNAPIFRVRLGRWRDRASAEAAARKIQDLPGIAPIILREGG